MIATKVARILNGDATDPEHWNDVAGYARLRANSFAPGHIELGSRQSPSGCGPWRRRGLTTKAEQLDLFT